LQPLVRRTPVLTFTPSESRAAFGVDAELVFKLELLQVTGTFKARGALANVLSLTAAQREHGVTAVSAGNHAVAVAFAAQTLGVSAKVVMSKTANRERVALTRSFGADLVLAEDVTDAFQRVREICEREGRVLVHPFEGERTVTGTATLGHEWFEQSGPLDAIVVAIGGGGLIAGTALATKLHSPATRVYGVEPEGAAIMLQSFAAGAPVTGFKPDTIADSLAPPMTTPYTFAVCRANVDRIVTVSDRDLQITMGTTLRALKLAVEPAGAAALAAAIGPLRAELAGKRVGILVCGSNIDPESFCRLLPGFPWQ
jgi:threonine dehydratase